MLHKALYWADGYKEMNECCNFKNNIIGTNSTPPMYVEEGEILHAVLLCLKAAAIQGRVQTKMKKMT